MTELSQYALYIGSATTLTKVLIDGLRLSSPGLCGRYAPILAFLFGPTWVLLFIVASGASVGAATIAGALIAGVFAGGGAIGVTGLQTKVAEDKAVQDRLNTYVPKEGK